jgi:hypothetical protein
VARNLVAHQLAEGNRGLPSKALFSLCGGAKHRQAKMIDYVGKRPRVAVDGEELNRASNTPEIK